MEFRIPLTEDSMNIRERAQPLAEYSDLVGVDRLVELTIGATATPDEMRLIVTSAKPLETVLPSGRKKKTATRSLDSGGSASDSESSDLSHEERNVRDAGYDVDSLCPVDTDADFGVECDFVDEGAQSAPAPELLVGGGQGSAASAPDDDGSDPEDGGAPLLQRHPAGTWKVWESLWFFATKTPGWADVKMHMKGPLRNVTTGMGNHSFSKTVSPHHYGDAWENPRRSLLVLRAWAIFRAGQLGWCKARPSRMREILKQRSALDRDLRALHGGAPLPLIGNEAASKLIKQWVPDVAAAIEKDVEQGVHWVD